MAILVDLSQVLISAYTANTTLRNEEADPLLIKHMVLNSILSYNKKFKRTYGNIVICCDSAPYWRKNIFPHYKANRKKDIESSSFDWKGIFNCLELMKKELQEFFPYKVIEVASAEADDVIAILSQYIEEDNIIIGGDKDYAQLLKYDNVEQYSTRTKKIVQIDNPEEFLQELIIRGDKDDGIPNIKSDADTFVNPKKRSASMMKKDIESWKKMKNPRHFCATRQMLRNYYRNKKLIDFTRIPKSLQQRIRDEYDNVEQGDKTLLQTYLMQNKMRNLLSDMNNF